MIRDGHGGGHELAIFYGIVDPVDAVSQLIVNLNRLAVGRSFSIVDSNILGGGGAGFVGVREGDAVGIAFVAALLHRAGFDFQRTCAVVFDVHRHGVLGIVPLGDSVIALVLGDFVNVGAGLLVGNIAEVASGGILVGVGIGQRQSRFVGQRGVLGTVASCGNGKGKRFLFAPFAAYQLLGNG